MRVLALIPARAGSKRLPHKNIHPCAGRPLIGWTCQAAIEAKELDRVLVSTDSRNIADVASSFGVEALFLRPPEISGDAASSLDAVVHALDWLRDNEGESFDAVALLQPTSPLRRASHIDDAIRLLKERNADTVVSVCSLPKQLRPNKMMVESGGLLERFNSHFGIPSEERFENVVVREGPAILIAREGVLRSGSFYGTRVAGYTMPWETFIDIDVFEDLKEAERRLLASAVSS
jgi:CMP-N,N'-diacetyllegionaminic acid synthase